MINRLSNLANVLSILLTIPFVSCNGSDNKPIKTYAQTTKSLISSNIDAEVLRDKTNHRYNNKLNLNQPFRQLVIPFFNIPIENPLPHRDLLDKKPISPITDVMIAIAKAGNTGNNKLDIAWGFLAKILEDLKNGKLIDINEKNTKNNDNTALHCAAALGKDISIVINIIRILIDSGAQVNVQNKQGTTPLHIAVCHGGKAMCALIIDNGADVNAKDKKDVTPLHIAAWHGGKAMCELLIDNGADVNAQDNLDRTPLHVAAYLGNKEAAKVLLAKQAKKNIKDKRGSTSVDLANSNNEHRSRDTALIEIFK